MSIHSIDDLKTIRNHDAIVRRLRWIDDRLRWHGELRRTDLIREFAISPQQASADIARYRNLAPDNIKLDRSSKAYLSGEKYNALYPKDPIAWAKREGYDDRMLPVEALILPERRMDYDVVAALFRGYETRTAVSIEYQSLSSPKTTARTICPHHLVDTGNRMHVRAWDDRRKIFGDFVVARTLRARLDFDYPWVDAVADTLWNEKTEIHLAPNEGLTASQRAVVEVGFGMRNGKAICVARKAMVVYVLDRLGLLESVRDGDGMPGEARDIRCLNPNELRPWLP